MSNCIILFLAYPKWRKRKKIELESTCLHAFRSIHVFLFLVCTGFFFLQNSVWLVLLLKCYLNLRQAFGWFCFCFFTSVFYWFVFGIFFSCQYFITFFSTNLYILCSLNKFYSRFSALWYRCNYDYSCCTITYLL